MREWRYGCVQAWTMAVAVLNTSSYEGDSGVCRTAIKRNMTRQGVRRDGGGGVLRSVRKRVRSGMAEAWD